MTPHTHSRKDKLHVIRFVITHDEQFIRKCLLHAQLQSLFFIQASIDAFDPSSSHAAISSGIRVEILLMVVLRVEEGRFAGWSNLGSDFPFAFFLQFLRVFGLGSLSFCQLVFCVCVDARPDWHFDRKSNGLRLKCDSCVFMWLLSVSSPAIFFSSDKSERKLIF